jgi:hypothetical protein
MQIGCGNGLGLGLVSDELLAGERTDSWTWSHTGRKPSFLFFFLFLFLPIPLENLGCLRLYFSWLLQQPFGYPLSYSPSETETRPSRLHWWFYLKKALAALSLSHLFHSWRPG